MSCSPGRVGRATATVYNFWLSNNAQEKCIDEDLWRKTSSFLEAKCNVSLDTDSSLRASLCFLLQNTASLLCIEPHREKLPIVSDQYCDLDGGILFVANSIDPEQQHALARVKETIKNPESCAANCEGLEEICQQIGRYGRLFMNISLGYSSSQSRVTEKTDPLEKIGSPLDNGHETFDPKPEESGVSDAKKHSYHVVVDADRSQVNSSDDTDATETGSEYQLTHPDTSDDSSLLSDKQEAKEAEKSANQTASSSQKQKFGQQPVEDSYLQTTSRKPQVEKAVPTRSSGKTDLDNTLSELSDKVDNPQDGENNKMQQSEPAPSVVSHVGWSGANAPFYEDTQTSSPGYLSGFASWVIAGSVLTFLAYVIFFRKQRVLAFLVEGPKPRRSGGRGGGNSRYLVDEDETVSDVMPMLKAA